MKKIIGFALILSACIFLVKCKDEEAGKREWPRLSTMPVTNISEQGAQFNAEIIFRGDFEILQYGFVWSKGYNPTIENSDKIVLTGSPAANTFSVQTTTTLGVNVTNHVRSFVQTADYMVYGTDVEFISLGSKSPKITSFEPETGSWGDTINITGEYFSYLSGDNVVKLGEIEAHIISVSDTLLSVIVPDKLNQNSVKVSVSILGNSAFSEQEFTYLMPEITSVSPLSGTFQDTITIFGNNFGRSISYNLVYFGSETNVAQIISVNPSRLTVIVPPPLVYFENSINVKSVGHLMTFGEPFLLNLPVIETFSPDTVFKQNEIIDIYGKNFNPLVRYNLVQIDGHTASIIEASVGHLKVQLPAGVIPEYNISLFKDVRVTVSVGYLTPGYIDNLNIHWESTWTRKKDFPGTGRHEGVAFSANGKGYFGTGFAFSGVTFFNDFWEYNQATDDWTRINDFPGLPRAAAVSLMIGGKGYVGTGSDKYKIGSTEEDTNHFKDFYSFDPVSGAWTRVADFGGIGRHSAASFVLNNTGYVGTGHWGNDVPASGRQDAADFWEYNPVSNTWTEVQSFPGPTEWGAGFNIGSKGYVYSYNDMYEFDGLNWQKMTAPVLDMSRHVAFSILNYGYFGLGSNHQGGTPDLWQYDPVHQSSLNLAMDYINSRFGGSVFVIGNKAYIIGGVNTFLNSDLNDVWEFDPSKPVL